jgi:hypothetical protein
MQDVMLKVIMLSVFMLVVMAPDKLPFYTQRIIEVSKDFEI